MSQQAEAQQRAVEREIVERCRLGDEAAYADLVKRYERRAYWVAYQMVGNGEDARDIAQEAFIRVFRSIERFDVKRKFYTWLYQIVVNLCIDHLRWASNRRTRPLDEAGDVRGPTESPTRSLEHEELRERINVVLQDLPPKDRTVIGLRDLQGLNAKDIAGITGSTHATVRWRLHRARQLFRKAWEARYGTPDGEDRTEPESNTVGHRARR